MWSNYVWCHYTVSNSKSAAGFLWVIKDQQLLSVFQQEVPWCVVVFWCRPEPVWRFVRLFSIWRECFFMPQKSWKKRGQRVWSSAAEGLMKVQGRDRVALPLCPPCFASLTYSESLSRTPALRPRALSSGRELITGDSPGIWEIWPFSPSDSGWTPVLSTCTYTHTHTG